MSKGKWTKNTIPYHKELDDILTKKGFKRKRISCDMYSLGKYTVMFYEDDSIDIYDHRGEKVSEILFDEITNGIFAEKH